MRGELAEQPVHGETSHARLIRLGHLPPRGKARTFIPFDTPKTGTRSLSSGVHIPQAGLRRRRGCSSNRASWRTNPAHSAFQRDDSGGLNGLHKRKAVVFGLPDLVFIRAVVQNLFQAEQMPRGGHGVNKMPARAQHTGKLSLGHGREDVQKQVGPAVAHRCTEAAADTERRVGTSFDASRTASLDSRTPPI